MKRAQLTLEPPHKVHETLREAPAGAVLSERRVLGLLMVVVTIALAWILLPFYGAILWGSIIALLFAPLYQWLLPRVGRRGSVAAFLTMSVALVIVILPAVLLALSLAQEAGMVYERLQSGELDPARVLHEIFDALPPWLISLLGTFGMADFATLQRKLAELLKLGSEFIATRTLSIGQDVFTLVLSVLIAAYLGFFLLRDGDGVVAAVRRAIPMAPGEKQELIDKFSRVLRATVKGNLVVAIVQGTLGGLAFWVLGIGGALLWAALMTVLSLLPAVGAGLVWLPVAAWLFATGSHWQGVGLALFGVFVIGLADNVLRPLLVGRDTGMPDYLVMITTFGGIAALGINGFVVGPTIAAMFIAVWHIQTATQPGGTGAA